MKAEEVWRVYHMPMILGGLSLLFIAISITIVIKSYQPIEPISFSSDVATGSAQQAIMTVDIEGAVTKPGVYTLSSGSRVEDAIVIAGGFAENADLEAIAKTFNRAAKLSDGAKLFIPSKNSPLISPNFPSSLATLISINSASMSELDSLSGIGVVIAGKIIAGRPYLRLEELIEKKIMSQSLFMKLKDQLTL